MSLEDTDRMCSPKWTLTQLKEVTTRQRASDYLEDFWSGWIAAPMLEPIPHGGWAQLTLACLAVEATASFFRTIDEWKNHDWHNGNSHLSMVRTQSGQEELYSKRAFCSMFELIFGNDVPDGVGVVDLGIVTYGVYRCGLAHRGLSKDEGSAGWLGVIDGQPTVFRNLSDQTRSVLSICPDLFAARIDGWFRSNIISALRDGTSQDVDAAFKSWCDERWGLPTSHWNL